MHPKCKFIQDYLIRVIFRPGGNSRIHNTKALKERPCFFEKVPRGFALTKLGIEVHPYAADKSKLCGGGVDI
jgi:hypothetical protein